MHYFIRKNENFFFWLSSVWIQFVSVYSTFPLVNNRAGEYFQFHTDEKPNKPLHQFCRVMQCFNFILCMQLLRYLRFFHFRSFKFNILKMSQICVILLNDVFFFFLSLRQVNKFSLLSTDNFMFARLMLQIKPLVEPTKQIMRVSVNNYDWHELFPEGKFRIWLVLLHIDVI